MPRKTRGGRERGEREIRAASMRPRPDAAENRAHSLPDAAYEAALQ